jgi:hypothetical protein
MAGNSLEVCICVEVPSREAMVRIPFVWVVKAAHDSNISKKQSLWHEEEIKAIKRLLLFSSA